MSHIIDAKSIIKLHEQCITDWEKEGVSISRDDFFKIVEENHSFNFQLWHAEDRARRDDKGCEYVYHAKREIDRNNQLRNDRMELMDDWLFHHLEPAPHTECPVNSETPGMMIDRLSILALKAYHMNLQTERKDVDKKHRDNCKDKLNVIIEQQKQLGRCLNELLSEIADKTRTFRIYHQFKMYNDPQLNPELYKHENKDNR